MSNIQQKEGDGHDEKIIHERAAGDFLLMHRSLWEKLADMILIR